MHSVSVIGVGCDDHGDQVAGLLVARSVAEQSGALAGATERFDAAGTVARSAAVSVHETLGAPADLLAAWSDCDRVIVVEAMPEDAAGVVRRCEPFPRGSGPDRWSIALPPRLRRTLELGPAPHRLTVVTISGVVFARHAAPSVPVLFAAERVAAEIVADLTPASQRPVDPSTRIAEQASAGTGILTTV